MDRTENLQRAQDARITEPGEREMRAEKSAAEFALNVGRGVAALLLVLKFVILRTPWYDVMSLMTAMFAAEELYKWKKLGDRRYLRGGLIWAAIALGFIVLYVVFMMK